MSVDRNSSTPLSGRFSPLRYPGGKGKLARFVTEIIRCNGLEDGLYVEPYAGGAAIAWELLLTGIVRKVHVNDLSRPIYAFWLSVLEDTENLLRLIGDTRLDIETWDKMKKTFSNGHEASNLEIGFAMFYLNRTNRSGILNGGPIGGRAQTGTWNMDARYNKVDLMARISRIAQARNRVTITNIDASDLIVNYSSEWKSRTLVYLDPPYFDKGRELYYNFYKHDDHASVALAVQKLRDVSWIVSYDDVRPIHNLYAHESWLQYEIGYSARRRTRGREAMFFSSGLRLPEVQGSMIELDRWTSEGGGVPYRLPTLPGAADVPVKTLCSQ